MSTGPRCGVVIPTYNGAHLLGPCLEALMANPPANCEMELVIVDDGSSDGTTDLFGNLDDRVRLISRQENGGFATACNDGAEAVSGSDFVVFLNNDTIPLAGWLDALVEEAAAHPQAAAIGAKLLHPDGVIQHAGIAIGQDRWPHHIYAGFPDQHPAVNRPRPMVAATAACLLVRTATFEDLGGFDTEYRNGYEDIDFCLRLGERGMEVRYCPASVLYHLESVTRWPDGTRHHVGHNSAVFSRRWRARVVPDDIDHYLRDGLLKIDYADDVYPVKMSISPLLASVQRETDDEDGLERVLALQTRRAQDLQARHTRALLEGSRDAISAPHIEPTASARPARDGAGELVNQGGFRSLGAGSPGHRVSVLMPVKNSAAELRETLPHLFAQRANAELEIVGVDSGSQDDTVAALLEFGATVVTIDPRDFDHGLTRNLAARHASGDVLVFLNTRSRPVNEDWLAPLLAALDADPAVAGACSRVVAHPDADLLTRRNVELDPSGGSERKVKRIDDWSAYRSMPVEQRRLLLNFHTVSAAIRAEVMERIPFRSVRTIGEDLLWAREVLEAGLALTHEPRSQVWHSHNYSLRDWFMRNVDDGVANHDINGRTLSDTEAEALVRAMIAHDWQFLAAMAAGEDLDGLRIEAAIRRVAQGAGQWLGTNYADHPPEAIAAFSRIAKVRQAGA